MKRPALSHNLDHTVSELEVHTVSRPADRLEATLCRRDRRRFGPVGQAGDSVAGHVDDDCDSDPLHNLYRELRLFSRACGGCGGFGQYLPGLARFCVSGRTPDCPNFG